jgi:hypothetical protein
MMHPEVKPGVGDPCLGHLPKNSFLHETYSCFVLKGQERIPGRDVLNLNS